MKAMTKRMMCIVLCLALAIAMAACGSAGTTGSG